MDGAYSPVLHFKEELSIFSSLSALTSHVIYCFVEF